jgi:ABC-type Fe3+/spermidine/putrescine transport system ATPase subunit
MEELRDSGVTILFVTHSMQQVEEFCNEAALLHKGRLISRGGTDEVIEHYQALLSRAAARRKDRLGLDRPVDDKTAQDEDEPRTPSSKKNSVLTDKSPSFSTGDVRIHNVELLDDHGRPVDVITSESNLTVRVHVRYMKAVDDSVVSIDLQNDVGLDVFSTNTTLEKTPVGRRQAGERVIVDFTFQVPLKHGSYAVAAAVSHPVSEDSHPDLGGATATFQVSPLSGRNAFTGLVHLPTRVAVFEPDRECEPSAGRE